MYSDGLLLPLAVPDFSMPYNVIIMTSTVVAVYMGALLTAMVKLPEAAEDVTQPNKQKKLKMALSCSLVIAVVYFVLQSE